MLPQEVSLWSSLTSLRALSYRISTAASVTAMNWARCKQARAGINSARRKAREPPLLTPTPSFFFFFFFGYPTSWRVCTGCQSAPCISSHTALRSVSLTAHSSNWEMVLLFPKGYPGGLFSRWGAGGREHECVWVCTSEWEKERERENTPAGNMLSSEYIAAE